MVLGQGTLGGLPDPQNSDSSQEEPRALPVRIDMGRQVGGQS